MRNAFGCLGFVLFVPACSSKDADGAGGPGAGDLTSALHSEFCADGAAEVPDTLKQGAKYEVCGVPLRTATTELERSSNVREFSGKGEPNLGCYAPEGYPDAAGASQKVTVTGFARIFSHGCESKNVKIEIYAVDSSKDDGTLGALIGKSVTTADDCETDGEELEVDECTRYECKFSYDGVPTETELVIKTSGSDWASLYDYNVYIPTSEVKGGKWDHDVRAVATGDYDLIPQTAMGAPITPGRGVIAGEVHDCDNVRLHNAVVGTNVERRLLTYFSDNEDSPLPQSTARATSILGLYAALDVPPGPVVVAAGGLQGGQFVTAGFHRARVYPDSITTVSFKGLRPFQVH